jgi:hypothetical protein
VIPFGVIVSEVLSDGIACRPFAEKNQSVDALGFERSEKPLKMRAHVGAAWWQPYRLDAFVVQELAKRFAE